MPRVPQGPLRMSVVDICYLQTNTGAPNAGCKRLYLPLSARAADSGTEQSCLWYPSVVIKISIWEWICFRGLHVYVCTTGLCMILINCGHVYFMCLLTGFNEQTLYQNHSRNFLLTTHLVCKRTKKNPKVIEGKRQGPRKKCIIFICVNIKWVGNNT